MPAGRIRGPQEILHELSSSKYVGASLELPFFPMKRTVTLSLEKPRKFDPLDFGNSESFSTGRVWRTCLFFSPKHVKVSFQLAQIVLHWKLPVLY